MSIDRSIRLSLEKTKRRNTGGVCVCVCVCVCGGEKKDGRGNKDGGRTGGREGVFFVALILGSSST